MTADDVRGSNYHMHNSNSPFEGDKMRLVHLLAGVYLFAFATVVNGQAVLTFGGNAQHTAIYQPAAQDLNQIRWSTSIDLNNTGAYAHYGAPLITAANTVIVPVKTASGFRIDTFNGGSGAAMYSLTTDYILPSYTWVPVYQPVVATGSFGTRLYYPAAGGTVYYGYLLGLDAVTLSTKYKVFLKDPR